MCSPDPVSPLLRVTGGIEPGMFREERAWTSILYDEVCQFYWVVDLADPHPENPRVYRIDHDANGADPFGIPLSERLAELILIPETQAGQQ